MRPTKDYSWPVPSIALADLITSPNDMIKLREDFPEIEYFGFDAFVEQIHYLRQFGVKLE